MSKENKVKITDLLNTMARLRDPENGCPWDLEQTYDSLTKHTMEEAYEVIDAVDNGDTDDLRDELGDLLLQVVFYAQIAQERGDFTFDDVVKSINDKLIRRHPHIFGDETAKTPEDVNEIWAKVKNAEKGKKAQKDDFTSVLDDIPLALPALQRLYQLDKKAANLGFDWEHVDDVFGKIEEEVAELKQALADDNASEEDIEMEFSDILSATSVLGRKLDINPERALQKGCTKFINRFQYIEKQAFKAGKPLTDYTVDEMMIWWDEAKILEKDAA